MTSLQLNGSVPSRSAGPGAWTSEHNDYYQYITIWLDSQKSISHIATQGRAYTREFVTEFAILTSVDGDRWRAYTGSNHATQLFPGNVDGESVKMNYFETPIIAQYIRINPTRWRDRISLRIELYGCDYVAESINLDGQGYVIKDLGLKPMSSQAEEVRLRIRTSRASGVVLYSRGTQGDVLALQMLDSRMLLNLDLSGDGMFASLAAGSLLDDNLWHDVALSRRGRDITLTVDRVSVQATLRTDMTQLDLNRQLFIGGVPNFNQEGLEAHTNFTGCLENLYLNHVDIFSERKHSREYKNVGEILTSCTYERVVSFTFPTQESYLKIPSRTMDTMNVSLDFRTYNEDGLLLYQKFSPGFVKLRLDKGRIKIELQGKGTPVVVIEPFDLHGEEHRRLKGCVLTGFLNDGLWHRIMLIFGSRDRIELHLDGKPSITTRRFSMMTGEQYLLGGGVYGTTGFIGCMRYVFIEGRYISFFNLSPGKYVRSQVEFDACHMVDKCTPNPCEHNGICRQNWKEFSCDCSQTGYTGAVCHIPLYPLSCQAYQIDNPKEKRADITIDLDGSGPLDPFPVSCEFRYQEKPLTILHHKNERTTDVKGFSKPGSFIQDIVYEADMAQIVELVNRSLTCYQSLRYDCFNSRLFNTPVPDNAPFEPFSWWVSRSNQKMDYWGGSLPGSRKCNCGLYGTCKQPGTYCNCDALGYGWLSDGGEITQREYLPVRQLRFGDTGATTDQKRGRYTLGPLVCTGDNLFDNVITFRYDDATVDLPTFDMSHSGDIYFHFKTTAENGVMIHSTGPTDYIKVVLSVKSGGVTGGDQIKFLYMAGNSPKGVSVETSYKLNDDNWHSVRVERNRKEARVIVDGSLTGEVREKAGGRRALYLTSPLVVGANTNYREGYVGCIAALMLNGQLVDLRGIAERQAPLYGVSPGCVGKCASNPCLNNGTCLERYSGYDCDCQWTAFKGPICADEPFPVDWLLFGLHSCRPLRRLPLTPPNRRQRLEWCRARSTWMTEWHRVVFSDESRFCLSSDSRRVRVWRRRGERSNPAAIVERPTVRQRGIMVWGAIAYDSRSLLLRIQGTMTAQRYVDDVLRPVTLPYLQGVPNALYQQDNARPHTARISQQALQDVQMLPWPPYSPDLSPIEHVWDIIGRRLHALPQPRSEDELWHMFIFYVRDLWAKMTRVWAEIGVNLGLDTYIRYDFEEEISTLEEYIRVQFITTDRTGMILGVSSKSGEYFNLMMSTSGHLRLVFDYGFERHEIIIKKQNFALGQNHDLTIRRSEKGSKITIKGDVESGVQVDNYDPIVHKYKIDDKADAQFNGLKSIYVGRNDNICGCCVLTETMLTGEGFMGCISRVQFDDHFPLRRFFQESRRANVRSFPSNITAMREDNCGIEPIVYPTEIPESRPVPPLPPGVYYGAHRAMPADESAVLGGVLVVLLVAVILMAFLISRYIHRQKGEYRTHEDTGAKDAPDADTAVIHSRTGPEVPRKKEWFI
ncbi:CNTNAP1 [Cordylochernes scorpioides]|uniref:CNTNAP1 n=1 Tax=Cordylochernes scorpioides TaxID=51811 RepID=A0ABY6LH53_9ARAC|nr:CNTNAP1 [Cordylochernes scorpioides]